MALELNKVYCMDCVEGMKQIADNSIDLIVTDPPYDVNYNKKSEILKKMDGRRDKQIERDKTYIEWSSDYNSLSNELFRVLKQNSHCYIFCGDKQITKWVNSMVQSGFKEPQILVWYKNKPSFDLTHGHKFLENKEFILFFQKGWKKLNTYKVERHLFRSVLNFDCSSDTKYHACAKPINLISFLCKLSSNKGDVCLDLFCGSGNHLISFIRLERNYIGFEVSSVYHQQILKRINYETKQTKLNMEAIENDTTRENKGIHEGQGEGSCEGDGFGSEHLP